MPGVDFRKSSVVARLSTKCFIDPSGDPKRFVGNSGSGQQEQRDQHPYKGLGSHLFSLLVIRDRGAADFLVCNWRNGDLQHTTSSALSCAPAIETGSISRKFSPGKYNPNANKDNSAAPPTRRSAITPG